MHDVISKLTIFLKTDPNERKANENFAYLNPAFVDIQPTQEELSEIKRISNVPFMQYDVPTPGVSLPVRLYYVSCPFNS